MKEAAGRGAAPFAVLVLAYACTSPLYALEPANLRLGPLYFTPTLGIEQLHTDNLFRSENQEVSTWGTIVSPRGQLWAQQDLDTYSVTYELEDGRYSDSDDDDYTNHLFRSDIHKEILGPHSIDLFAKYFNGFEARGTGLTEGTLSFLVDEPLKYDLTGFGAQYTLGNERTRGRLELELRSEERKYKNFRDLTRRYDRDADVQRSTVYYNVSGRTDVLAEWRRTDTDYRLDSGDFADPLGTLDSDEQLYLVGASWEATRNTTGSVRVGAFDRELESDARSNDDGFHWEVDFLWEPRTYTTLALATRRVSTETNGVGDYTDTREYQASWDHEWSSRLATTLELLYADDEYPGSARNDDRYEFGARVDYRFRLWFDVGAGYRYEERSSAVPTLDYDRNEFFIDVKLSL